jgi:hypothetical protein
LLARHFEARGIPAPEDRDRWAWAIGFRDRAAVVAALRRR